MIASQSQVYKLEPKPFEQQVTQLVQHRQFDLALQIAVCFSFSPSKPSLSLSPFLPLIQDPPPPLLLSLFLSLLPSLPSLPLSACLLSRFRISSMRTERESRREETELSEDLLSMNSPTTSSKSH